MKHPNDQWTDDFLEIVNRQGDWWDSMADIEKLEASAFISIVGQLQRITQALLRIEAVVLAQNVGRGLD
jgi:hypothetical protein